MRYPLLRTCLFLSLMVATAVSGLARVVRVEVESREEVLGGRAFGPGGPYEKLTGVVYFEFDPANPVNARIIDIELAPRNERGMVEARANFMVLRPKRPQPGGGTAFLEVSNRGGKSGARLLQRRKLRLRPEHGGALR